MQKICVIGGGGFIGTSLATRLSGLGWQVSIPSRRPLPAHAGDLRVLPGVRLVTTDVHDPAALSALLAGHDAVISMAGILHGSRRAFARVHDRLPAKIVAACRQHGIRRLLHVSALGAAPDAPSFYQQSKAAGERHVIDSGLDWTLFRPSVVFGRGDSFLTLFARLNRQLPLIPLAGAATLFQPVWVGDVAHALTASLQLPQTAGRAFDLAGPARYTLQQLVEYAGRLAGHPRPVVPVPWAAGWLQAALFECLPGTPLMSRDNLRSLLCDNISEAGFPEAALGFAPTALEAVAPGYLRP